MKQQVRNLQESRRLLASEDGLETVAAMALLFATVGPVLWQLWQVYQMWDSS
jgi:uncharacterized protein YaaW (UPF0174 family)